MKFVEDGSMWYNYFHVRKYNHEIYYIAWNGTKENAWPGMDFTRYNEAKWWISMNKDAWKEAVDKKFESEVLNVNV